MSAAAVRTLPRLPRRASRNGCRHAGLIAIAGLHVAGLFALLQIDTVRKAVVEAAPIMVGLVEVAPPPPAVKPPPPPPPRKVEPPKPRLIAVEPAAPAAMEVPIQPEVPEPEPAPPPPPAPAVEAAPPPVIPPNFLAAYLDNPAPEYPGSSRRLRETGRVLLRVLVAAQGTAKEVRVEASSGFDRLDRAAVDAVRRWRFVPAKRGDQALEAWVLVPIDFNLKS